MFWYGLAIYRYCILSLELTVKYITADVRGKRPFGPTPYLYNKCEIVSAPSDQAANSHEFGKQRLQKCRH
jgi:hypothetical protein